ncbi:MAG: hypothetical protein JWO03_2229 [Bacteroidetes bacterium]|nr:hypothetical protein [Bacteroidota bacterium]
MRAIRLILLLLLPLSTFAATPQKTVIDYFLLLPPAAFSGIHVWTGVGNTNFTAANKKRMLTNLAGKPMPAGTEPDGKEVNIYVISRVDTTAGSLYIHDLSYHTAAMHIWKEKSGSVLIGVSLIQTPGTITENEVSFYRYDGTKMTKVENMLPKLPISEFVKKNDLEMDSISPALTPRVIYDFPSEGEQTISCRLDFAFWSSDSENMIPSEKPYQYLTTNQVHEVTLQYTADGFKILQK